MCEPYKLWMGDLWECRGCGGNARDAITALSLYFVM
jgi:hypothetical protein